MKRKMKTGICRKCRQKHPVECLQSDRRLPDWRFRYCPMCLKKEIDSQTLTCFCGRLHVHPINLSVYLLTKADNRCPICRITDLKRESHIVSTARGCAIKYGGIATLTLDQWIQTLNYYKGMCAYCSVRPYQVLEHFVPLTLGSGTTADNCVPACLSCNSLKRNLYPDEVKAITIDGVKCYLDRFSCVQES